MNDLSLLSKALTDNGIQLIYAKLILNLPWWFPLANLPLSFPNPYPTPQGFLKFIRQAFTSIEVTEPNGSNNVCP